MRPLERCNDFAWPLLKAGTQKLTTLPGTSDSRRDKRIERERRRGRRRREDSEGEGAKREAGRRKKFLRFNGIL